MLYEYVIHMCAFLNKFSLNNVETFSIIETIEDIPNADVHRADQPCSNLFCTLYYCRVSSQIVVIAWLSKSKTSHVMLQNRTILKKIEIQGVISVT